MLDNIFKPNPSIDNIYDAAMLVYDSPNVAQKMASSFAMAKTKK